MQKHNPRIMFRSAVLQLEEFSHEICEPDRYGSIDLSHNLRAPIRRRSSAEFWGYAPVEREHFKNCRSVPRRLRALSNN
jgi:hypothetical protein